MHIRESFSLALHAYHKKNHVGKEIEMQYYNENSLRNNVVKT